MKTVGRLITTKVPRYLTPKRSGLIKRYIPDRCYGIKVINPTFTSSPVTIKSKIEIETCSSIIVSV